MQSGKSKRILVILSIISVVLLVVLGLMWFWPYNIDSYSGDGRIRDSGFWSYYRYHITFPQIPLSEAKTYTFDSRGLPPVPLSLGLYISGKTDLATSKAANTSIEFKFVELDGSPNGRIVCQGGGPLKDWILSYAPASFLTSANYWHRDFGRVNVKSRAEYRLYLVVKNIDPAFSHISLKPRLSGGGNELP